MKVTEALRRRHSVRAFLDRAVDRADIEAVLDAAFTQGRPSEMDYHYYPTQWGEPFRRRRVECGHLLYRSLKISREDRERRRQQWIENYRAFGAPCVIFVLIRRGLESGSFMDAGMFIQSVMLAASEFGLSTCAQAALGEYPDIVRRALGFDDDHIVLGDLTRTLAPR